MLKHIQLKKVGLFKGRQRLKLCPITLLVGDNGTGKTTALSCVHENLRKACRHKLGYPQIVAETLVSIGGIYLDVFDTVSAFGRRVGLFQDMRVVRSAVPELEVRQGDLWIPLKDAGSGTLHIVPMLLKFFALPHCSHLFEYPERCLNSQTQAHLTSLFTGAAAKKAQSCVIETDSDAIIDRVRIDIRTGRIPPEDVSLAYFERRGRKFRTHIHNIAFDMLGNFKAVPPGYRAWHLRESDRLMGFLD